MGEEEGKEERDFEVLSTQLASIYRSGCWEVYKHPKHGFE